MNTITYQKRKSLVIYPLMRPADRLAALESIMGIWKNRRPDPIKELQKMRRERERKIPLLH